LAAGFPARWGDREDEIVMFGALAPAEDSALRTEAMSPGASISSMRFSRRTRRLASRSFAADLPCEFLGYAAGSEYVIIAEVFG